MVRNYSARIASARVLLMTTVRDVLTHYDRHTVSLHLRSALVLSVREAEAVIVSAVQALKLWSSSVPRLAPRGTLW